MCEDNITALKQQLDRQLALLLEEGNETTLKVREAIQQERSHYVTAYLWWYAAKDIDAYLEGLYEKYQINTRRSKYAINFRPLLTLLSNGRISENDLHLWQIALNQVHTEFERRFDHYKDDAHNRLCHFIDINGGKTGLANFHKKDSKEIEDDEEEQLIKALLFTLDEEEFESLLIKEATAFYSAKTQLTNLPVLQANAHGFSTVLIQQTSNGSQLIGSCDSEEVIHKILTSIYRNDFNALPTTLRIVLEPLNLFNVPTSVCKNIDKYIEYVKTDSVVFGKEKKLAEKRLLYRKHSNDFLLSNVWTSASPVLIAKPKFEVFSNLEGDIYLSSFLRRCIEVKLLHQSMFNVFTVDNTKQFNPSPPNSFARFSLELKTKLDIKNSGGVTAEQIIGVTENLRHPNITWRGFFGDLHGEQVDIIQQIHSECTWHGELDLNGVRSAVNVFFKQWINAYANNATRDRNKLFKIRLDTNGMQLEYEIGENGHGIESAINIHQCDGEAIFNVRSTDFAFTLRQLSDIDIIGLVKLEACNLGIILTFESTVHHYTIVIPSCDEKYNRNKEFFYQYAPATSTLTQAAREHDEYDSEFATIEQEIIERNALSKAMEKFKKS